MRASDASGWPRRVLSVLRSPLERRRELDQDVDRVNEIANGLAAASLALYADDDETAQRAVQQTLNQASEYLSLTIDRQRARTRRRRGVGAGGAAAGLIAAAALVVGTPTDHATPPLPVAHEEPAEDAADVAVVPDVAAPSHLADDRRGSQPPPDPPATSDGLAPPATLIDLPTRSTGTVLVDVRSGVRAAETLAARTAQAPESRPSTGPGGAASAEDRAGDSEPGRSGEASAPASPVTSASAPGRGEGRAEDRSPSGGPSSRGQEDGRTDGGTFATASVTSPSEDRATPSPRRGGGNEARNDDRPGPQAKAGGGAKANGQAGRNQGKGRRG
jgi:hypothetical protein